MSKCSEAKVGSTIPIVFTVKDRCTKAVITLLGTDAISMLFKPPSGTVYAETTAGNLGLHTDGTDGKIRLTPPDTTYFANAEVGMWHLDGTITRVSGEVVPIFAATFEVRPTLVVV